MLVDKTEFEAWMERIMGELYRISRKLDKAETREKHLNYLNGERLYDNQEVCLLLRISKRTLQRYRNNGVLKFYSIYHKTYYKESDLHEFIRNNFDENEIKRQAREDKLSESYPLPENKSMFLLCTDETTAVRQEIPNCVLMFVIAMASYSCETG